LVFALLPTSLEVCLELWLRKALIKPRWQRKLGGNMKKLFVLMALVMASVLLPALAQADGVNVDIFSGFTPDPCCFLPPGSGGAPFSGFVGSFLSPDINFGNPIPWNPFGLVNFGADITSNINVASTGLYTFSLTSDDGSHLLIDGSLIIDNGGTHGPITTLGSVSLTAGLHSFEVQYYECCGPPALLQVVLPSNVAYVPEPGVATLLGAGLSLLGIVGSFRKKFTGL
jgi:hypothetical protein